MPGKPFDKFSADREPVSHRAFLIQREASQSHSVQLKKVQHLAADPEHQVSSIVASADPVRSNCGMGFRTLDLL